MAEINRSPAGDLSERVVTLALQSEAETARFAERLASFLQAGDIVALHGDLGAGKTTLTRSLVRALGSPAAVSSPTFTIVHEYGGGRLPAVHIDAYRLSGPDEAEDSGLDEYLLRGDSVIVIEWPERIERLLPESRLDVTLIDSGGEEEGRDVRLEARSSRWTPVLDALETSAC